MARMRMGTIGRTVGLAAGLVALSVGGALAEFQTLEGSVSYREKIALHPEALVEITLEDVSKMDVAATVLAHQTVRPQGQVPVDFALRYDDRMVVDSGRYSVRAVIRLGEDVLWRSTRSFAALTQDAPEQVDVMVERVRLDAPSALTTGAWLVVRINGEDVAGDRLPQMEFGEDGRVSGTSGCNRFNGSYTAKGSALEFGPLASTRMACPGALGAQEMTFFQALETVVGHAVQDGHTVFVDAEGTAVIKLLAQ
ncbi:META domain-containing protein [Shimia marina]|uniref:Heat-inducible protein n=1 Tax=Shimia marina TaxID=321267 RepID=A0A0P1FDM9_9RHOB|nr:META domain-containing protein [Shimia marina]CUH54146.1 heat-inducible protein [Shimia marina]SFD96603.1 putative lipoprotein [Shimia marina]